MAQRITAGVIALGALAGIAALTASSARSPAMERAATVAGVTAVEHEMDIADGEALRYAALPDCGEGVGAPCQDQDVLHAIRRRAADAYLALVRVRNDPRWQRDRELRVAAQLVADMRESIPPFTVRAGK